MNATTTEEEETPCGSESLKCKNGSTCKLGSAPGDEKHQHIGLLSTLRFGLDGKNYHCECPPGFIGQDCSVKVTECRATRSDLVHSCYYGSTCIEADNDHGLLDRYCDCSTAELGHGQFVAGLMCQYKATSICLNEHKVRRAVDQFCVNGGKCIRQVSTHEGHPGCTCDDGKWEGQHCEFESGTLIDDALDLFQQRQAELSKNRNGNDIDKLFPPQGKNSSPSDEGMDERTLFYIAGGIFAAGVIIMILGLYLKKSRKNRNQSGDAASRGSRFGIPLGPTKTPMYQTIQSPPPDVFLASRKKEVDFDYQPSPVEQVDFDNQHPQSDVEMLDAETSRMLEEQFKHSELIQGESRKKSQDSYEKLGSDDDQHALPYYEDNEEEDIDETTIMTPSGRITMNSGHYPLSRLEADGSNYDNDGETSPLSRLEAEGSSYNNYGDEIDLPNIAETHLICRNLAVDKLKADDSKIV